MKEYHYYVVFAGEKAYVVSNDNPVLDDDNVEIFAGYYAHDSAEGVAESINRNKQLKMNKSWVR